MDDNKIKAFLESVNIADNLDKELLITIGKEAKAGFEKDLLSRQDWENSVDEWIKLANQVAEVKTYPWSNASNVKYPLLSTAAMQFAARAYPSLVPSDRKVVKAKVIGKDPTGEKTEMAEAVSIFMSYQIMDEMEGWEEDMDKMLLMLPVIGVMFKKTYWDASTKKNCSRLVLPKNLIVDYWTQNLKEAERISEILYFTPRKIKERQLAGLWLDVELGDPVGKEQTGDIDSTTPHEIVEQHTFLDIDEDDYPEPYIVTFQRHTGLVLRISPRFDQDTVTMDEDGKKPIKIDPIHYYTKYGFIPSADGGFYDSGFGTLLGPINESVNTLINQLIDAGHMSALQGGFLGKGLRLRMGETRFTPGEWKVVNATGDDLKKQIVPLPVRDPSNTLLELMGSLITSGKELASVAEIFVGKMPGQNTPATTTMATIEQGMKVFTAVYKRIYRSLKEEFEKLYRLNALYLNPTTNVDYGVTIGPEHFDTKNHKICPGADPTAISQTEKLMKAQGLMELLPTGVLDPLAVVKRVLEAQEQPHYEQLLSQQIQQTGQFQPPPNPKLQEMQMKGQIEQQKIQAGAQNDERKMQLDERSQQVQLAMKQQEHALEMAHKQQAAQLSAAEAEHKQKIFSAAEQAKLNQAILEGQVSLHQKAQEGAIKTAAMREQAVIKAKQANKQGTTKK